MYSIRLITNVSEFEDLRIEWSILLNNAVFDTFFCSYEWCYCWWKCFALSDDKLSIVVVEQDGVPVAIAPLMIRRIKEYGFNLKVLRFIGTPNSDRCDVIIHKDAEAVVPELSNFIFKQLKGWTQFHLNEVPNESLFSNWLQSNYPGVNIEAGSECPYVPLDKWVNWDEYYASLSRKTRQELNRKNNALRKEGKSQFFHSVNPDVENQLFTKVRELEINSTKAQHLPVENLALAEEKYLSFQKMLSDIDGNYQVLLVWLEREGELIAYLYGYIYKRKYYAYNMAYSSEAIEYYPGKLVMNETIRYCKENEIELFDFLRGATYLKSRWASESNYQQNIYCLKNKPVNWLYSFLVFKLRPAIKKHILPRVEKLRKR